MSRYVRDNRFALEELKRIMKAKARGKFDELLRSFTVPVTRQQWSAWLADNMAEFRAQMVSAPARRRYGSVRLRARSGLPAPATRLQPQADGNSQCREEWARNLANRTGWHGVKTHRQGVIMIIMMHLNRRTYYLNFPNQAATGAPTCALDETFGWLGATAHPPGRLARRRRSPGDL